MKKQILSLILFLLIYIYIVTCTACSNRSPSTDHIEALFKEYGIRKYNYFITDDNKTLTKNNFNETTNLGEKWIETLSLPLILTKEIRNEHVYTKYKQRKTLGKRYYTYSREPAFNTPSI